MEERKLIKSGPGSYAVTVPISWVKKNRLKPGAIIIAQETGFNTVTLSAKPARPSPELRETAIDAEGKSPDAVINLVISAYLNNFSTITLTNPDSAARDKLLKYLPVMTGLSIVEKTSRRIEIQDLLDLTKIPIRQTVRRIDMMIRGLFSDFGNAAKGPDSSPVNANSLPILGQSFLVQRILRLAAREPAVLEQAGIGVQEVIDTLRLVITLEDIADRIRRSILILQEKRGLPALKGAVSALEAHYRDAAEAYFAVDREKATRVMERKAALREILAKTLKQGASVELYNELLSLEKLIRGLALIANDQWTPYAHEKKSA